MKKVISLLAVSMLSLLVATAASAAPNVAVDNVTAKAGETVTVDVVLKDNVLFDDLAVEFGYDAEVLTLKSATTNNITGMVANVPQLITKNPYNMGWTGYQVAYNGKITTLTFEVAADAAPGKYAVTVDYYKGNNGDYVDGVSCNFAMDWELTFAPQPIGLTYTSGSITVESDGPTEPTLAAEKTADGVAITAASPEAITGKFIVAAYDAEGLVKVEVLDAAATATSTVTGATIKVMWWDSLTGLTSIAPAVTL